MSIMVDVLECRSLYFVLGHIVPVMTAWRANRLGGKMTYSADLAKRLERKTGTLCSCFIPAWQIVAEL